MTDHGIPDDVWSPPPEDPLETQPGFPVMEVPDWSRRLATSAAVVTPVVAALLGLSGAGLWDALWLATLLAALPILSIAQVPLAHEEPVERVPVYLGSSAFLLVLAAVSFQLGARGAGMTPMGLDWPPAATFVTWTGALMVGAAAVVLAFHKLGSALGIPESPLLQELLPRTEEERSAFAGLSLAAGLGEELAYRAYAITTLAPLIGSAWGAAAISSAVFGCLHAYQGVIGVLRTAILGFLLAVAYLVSGSLWPGIVAHALMDLVGGLVVGEKLLRR